jgi:hypothetical protein
VSFVVVVVDVVCQKRAAAVTMISMIGSLIDIMGLFFCFVYHLSYLCSILFYLILHRVSFFFRGVDETYPFLETVSYCVLLCVIYISKNHVTWITRFDNNLDTIAIEVFVDSI